MKNILLFAIEYCSTLFKKFSLCIDVHGSFVYLPSCILTCIYKCRRAVGLGKLYVELNKIFRTVYTKLDKTFIFSSQVTMMFQKEFFFENKKIIVRFSILDFPAKPAKQKKQVALRNHWGYTLAELRPRPRNGWISFLIFYFFFNSWSGPRPTSAPIVAKNLRKASIFDAFV